MSALLEVHIQLIKTMHDAHRHSDCTIWVGQGEALFDRLAYIYEASGGDMRVLHNEFPSAIPEPELVL